MKQLGVSPGTGIFTASIANLILRFPQRVTLSVPFTWVLIQQWLCLPIQASITEIIPMMTLYLQLFYPCPFDPPYIVCLPRTVRCSSVPYVLLRTICHTIGYWHPASRFNSRRLINCRQRGVKYFGLPFTSTRYITPVNRPFWFMTIEIAQFPFL